jgi:hypothetical protein
MVAAQPSNNNSLTYGFFHTRTMKPGNASERTTNRVVAQYVLITLTRKAVKKARMIRVSKSPNEDAKGVEMLSKFNIWMIMGSDLGLLETFEIQEPRMT